MRIAIPILTLLGALAALITVGIRELGIPEVHVRQLLAGGYAGMPVKIQGRIASIASEARPVRFEICDKENAQVVVPVIVDAVRPDIFQVGNDVAVEGVYDPSAGLVSGTRIHTKCPSKYKASESVDLDGAGGYGASSGTDRSIPSATADTGTYAAPAASQASRSEAPRAVGGLPAAAGSASVSTPE